MCLSFIDLELNSKKALLLTSGARNYPKIGICTRVPFLLSLQGPPKASWPHSHHQAATIHPHHTEHQDHTTSTMQPHPQARNTMETMPIANTAGKITQQARSTPPPPHTHTHTHTTTKQNGQRKGIPTAWQQETEDKTLQTTPAPSQVPT